MAAILSRPQCVNPRIAKQPLTHWGRVTHICVGKLTIIGSNDGLSPSRRQAIIWTNAGILLIGPRGTSFSEILIGTQAFSFRKMHLKMSPAKWRRFCLGLNVLKLSGGSANLGLTYLSKVPIVLLHNYYSPSGEQNEQRILHVAHKLEQPTAGCIAIFQ